MDDRLYFSSDYQEGAHPAILQRLLQTNLLHSPGYGTDEFCAAARSRIRDACRCPEAEVHFLTGGTQTNAAVLNALVAPYEGVLAAETGHIAVHEAGAIEHGGHKVLPLPQAQGKLSAGTLERWLDLFFRDENRDHLVWPGAVYLSQPTEWGTLYTLEELEAIHDVCSRYALPIYLDGARLAYALACPENDVTLPDLARLCACFYIGGTKCGALFGEAVVIPEPARMPHFFTVVKQNGALLAKGRILGLQFDTLFTDGLYQTIGTPAIESARAIRGALRARGIPLAIDAPTNQVFPIWQTDALPALRARVEYGFWENLDGGRTVIRLAASWATTRADTERLCALIAAV